MTKVKIALLKTTLDKELAAEYGIDGLTACPMMKAGDRRRRHRELQRRTPPRHHEA